MSAVAEGEGSEDLHVESRGGTRPGAWVSAGVSGHHPLGREHPPPAVRSGGWEAERGSHGKGGERPGRRVASSATPRTHSQAGPRETASHRRQKGPLRHWL